MISRSRLILALLLAFAAPAWADVHPNTAGGFPVDQSFHVGDIDNVNLFNGALTVTIPIGPSYPVNGGFSYSLKLVANSNPWIFQTVHTPINGVDTTFIQANPNPCANAGLGWRVSLGRLNPPCQVPDANNQLPGPVYQDEMGTDHVFYPTLHAGDPEDAPVTGINDMEYTRDGSYLRLKVYASGFQEVEFPDGMVRKFDSTGMPIEIRDAFSNWLHITYPTTSTNWVLTDSQGRTHTLYFTSLASVQVLDHIVLSAFGGATATYQFTYSTQTIGRGCPNTDVNHTLAQGPSVFVPILTGVTLPDSSTFQMPLSSYITALAADGMCTVSGGNLLGITLPTLGRMEWTWQTFHFHAGSSVKVQLQSNPGVATRTMRNAAGSVLGTWTYTQFPAQPSFTENEVTTTVTDPLGNRIVNYFSSAVSANFTGWSTYDYSLPFTRNTTLNVAPGVDLNLSRQTFAPGASVPSRSEYVLYERDPFGGGIGPAIYNTNRRPMRSRTVYEDDGTYAGSVSSQFDGVGHYRSQDTEGNFPGSNVRHHFGNINPAQGTYVVNAAANTASGFSVVPSSSPWVLETMSYALDTENGATAQTDLCYAPSTSTVIRKRAHRLDGASQSANDLVSVYGLDGTGNVTSEKYYGGNSPGYSVATGVSDLCSMALPATPQYQINHTYSSGVRATSQYAGASFFSLQQTIDAATGLVSSSQDTAGVLTSYLYDNLGRRTWSKPAQSGWTQYVYTAATPTIKPNVIVRQRDNGSEPATILAVSQVVFDDFGRVYQELRTMPDGSTSKRQTAYDGVGNKSTVSEVMTGNPTNVTTFSGYDPFGRPATIKPPDGATHNVTMTYHGVRQVDRTVKVGIVLGSETAATTTEIYDRQGRLLSVAEPSGSGGALVTTTYGYDVGNRLSSVSTPGQSRSFVYDRAGLLQSETHPEKGASGNGTVTYTGYDAAGDALRKTDGPNDLAFVYDPEERLLQVNEASGLSRPLKSFTYAPSNGTNDLRLGKLWQDSRYNYFTLGGSSFTARIDEIYVYGGRDGRVSSRTTASSTGESFTQGFSYTALGLKDTITYPSCTHADDHFNQMLDMTSGSEHDLYIYTVDDERVWSYDLVRNLSHWTIRDLGGKVLRDYVNNNGTWGLQTDYLYRDGLLLASETRTGQYHYHLDHLGTPRLITTISGTQAAYHAYYPFGEEATAFNQDTERMKFTGHERDLASPNGAGDDLDYMHARFFNPLTSRFTSTDSIGGNLRKPQSWSLYSYVTDNPLQFTDPTGQSEVWVHQYAPTGMTLDEWGAGYEIQVVGALWRGTTANPNTGLWGLGSLMSGNRFFKEVSGFSLDRSLKMSREFYQKRFDQMAGQGNDLAALIDYVGLELVIPQDSQDLALQGIIMILGPEFKLLKFTEDEQALVALAKEAKKLGGVTAEEAKILGEWAKEYGMPFRGPEVHPGRPFGQFPHIHVGPVNHIPVR